MSGPLNVETPGGNRASGEAAEAGNLEANNTTQGAVIGLTYPAPGSVKGRFLADLLAGMKLTHLDCWERHGSRRAAHHVLRLRKAGWQVNTTEIEAPTRDGRTARIAQYALSLDAIAAAGDPGRQYVAEAMAASRR